MNNTPSDMTVDMTNIYLLVSAAVGSLVDVLFYKKVSAYLAILPGTDKRSDRHTGSGSEHC